VILFNITRHLNSVLVRALYIIIVIAVSQQRTQCYIVDSFMCDEGYIETCELRTHMGRRRQKCPLFRVVHISEVNLHCEQHFGSKGGVLISQKVLISQGCYSQVSLYKDTIQYMKSRIHLTQGCVIV
jgi:hypothetical protein